MKYRVFHGEDLNSLLDEQEHQAAKKMESANEPASSRQIAELIKRRQTLKVIGEIESCVKFEADVATRNNENVLEAIRSAGWAPFHYNRGVDDIAEPWRVHVLWHQECQEIARNFHRWFDNVSPSNKLPAMLSACGALILVTWLPQFKPGYRGESLETEEHTIEKQDAIDEEHLAATSAMVQNLILILTAHNMGTYWSSGGQFRTRAMFERLEIQPSERFLAGVFVEYPESRDQPVKRLAGKQRENRCRESSWLREVKLPMQRKS